MTTSIFYCPVDPTEMDLAAAKQVYMDTIKVTTDPGVSCSSLIVFGSPERALKALQALETNGVPGRVDWRTFWVQAKEDGAISTVYLTGNVLYKMLLRKFAKKGKKK